MTIQNLFQTPIKILSFPNYEEINRILGQSMSRGFNKNFYENLNEEEITKTKDLFIKEAKLFCKETVSQTLDLSIVKSWFSYHDKNNWNTPHGHPSNFIVGVYYVKTNDKAGDLLLLDPRGTVNFTQYFDTDSKCETVGGRCYFKIKPKVGDLIFFPAYVVHSVEPNLSDETRISLAMNFQYKDFSQFKRN
jgi:uncharacterized protein (TIGR02466 family)